MASKTPRTRRERSGSDTTASTDRFHPWRELREEWADILLELTDLKSGDAWWDPQYRVILMDRRLGQAERRCALAHELAHIRLRHSGECGKLRRLQEQDADQMAAMWLIELDQLADALAWSTDPHEVAEHLWVTEHILQVRMQHLHPAEIHKLRRSTAHHREGEEA